MKKENEVTGLLDNKPKQVSLNPITGCTKHSEGCKNCYAERMAIWLNRVHKNDNRNKYANGFKLTLHPDVLEKKVRVKPGENVFMCSMSDIFHEDVPDEFIIKIFEYMERNINQHFSICTKRAERLAEMAPFLPWRRNLWAGVTIEHGKYIYRAELLRKVPAVLRFIIAEPLLSSLADLDLTGIGYLSVGGESGDKRDWSKLRVTKKEWVIELRDKANAAGIPFFFKQWGNHPDSGPEDRDNSQRDGGCMLDGQEYFEEPPLWREPSVEKVVEYSIFDEL